MRFIKYSFLAAVAVILVTLALANAGSVTLNVLPPALANATGFGWAVELPLFVVIFGGVLAGLLIGFVWEWLREHRHRVAAKTNQREAKKLEREVASLKGRKNEGRDEILALVEDAEAAR